MAWDRDRKGHYCNRCGTNLNLSIRQEKFMKTPGITKGGGDPYVGVTHFSFDSDHSISNGLMYCATCEPALMELLQKFNEEGKTK